MLVSPTLPTDLVRFTTARVSLAVEQTHIAMGQISFAVDQVCMLLLSLGNYPSILETMPEEHIQAACEARSRRSARRVMSPPAGYIRVKYYAHLDYIARQYRANLVADIPLSDNGELDLECIRRLWGLENCLVVDPLRWTVFYPRDPHNLSPLAIRNLTETQPWIAVVEPENLSKATLWKRACRRAVLDVFGCFAYLSYLFSSFILHHLDRCTSIPWLCRQGWDHCLKVVHDVDRAMYVSTTAERLQTWAVILGLLLLLAISVWSTFLVVFGYVDVADVVLSIPQRWRMWVRTGSFSI